MIKVLAVGDMHHKASTLAENEMMQSRILEVGGRLKPDFFVLLGDLHDDFEKIHSTVLTSIETFVQRLAGIAPVYILIGNHDLVNNSVFLEPLHPFNAMDSWDNVYVVDKPAVHMYKDINFAFCPYVPPGRFKEAINDYGRYDVIFCHQEFHGCKMGSIVSEAGDVYPQSAPMAISGHIHEYDRLQDNLLYIGTPADTAFGSNSHKTISLFQFSKENFTFGMTEERIDLGLPKRRTYDLTIEQARSFKVPANTIARINVMGPSGDLIAFKKTLEYKQLEATSKIVPKPTDIALVITGQGRVEYIKLVEKRAREIPAVYEAFLEANNEAKS